MNLNAAKTATIKKRVLERYARLGTIAAATKGLCDRHTPSEWYQADPEFAAGWEEAAAIYVERLEGEADRRAVKGVLKGVYYKGTLVAREREYSDTLLMFRLKKLDPAYRDKTDVNANATGETTINIISKIPRPGDEPANT